MASMKSAALEPTAENLEKARLAMAHISPAARDMVRQLQDLRHQHGQSPGSVGGDPDGCGLLLRSGLPEVGQDFADGGHGRQRCPEFMRHVPHQPAGFLLTAGKLGHAHGQAARRLGQGPGHLVDVGKR